MKPLSLRSKILGMAAVTITAVLVVIESHEASVQFATADEVRRAVEALGEAFEVSVQQLGAAGEPDEDLLRDYVRRLGPHGVRRITVLSPEKDRLAGSHDTTHAFVIEEEPGADARHTFDLLVPVIAGASKLGYVQFA